MKDFILEIPKWEGKIVFSEEVITLFLVIVALIAGVLLCFWGGSIVRRQFAML